MCTTLYRNLMQASNFGGSFDQLFLLFILFSENASLLLLYHGAKKSKMTNNKNDQGGGGSCRSVELLNVGRTLISVSTANSINDEGDISKVVRLTQS